MQFESQQLDPLRCAPHASGARLGNHSEAPHARVLPEMIVKCLQDPETQLKRALAWLNRNRSLI